MDLILCLIGISSCLVSPIVARVAIVGGHVAKIDEFPYHVSLKFQHFGHDCGGGIIGEQYILTGAHCVIRDDGKFYTDHISILAGTNDLHGVGITIDVKKIFVPSEYTPHAINTSGDIAILKLKHPLEIAKHGNLKRLHLPGNKHEFFDDKVAQISGFGYDKIKVEHGKECGSNSDTKLRYADADILNHTICQSIYHKEKFSEKHMCARTRQLHNNTRHGVCAGDSGGPLVYNETIVGILSISPTGCTERHTPAIYTRVSRYMDFIEKVVKNKIEKYIRVHEIP